jgi:hypothetical protein
MPTSWRLVEYVSQKYIRRFTSTAKTSRAIEHLRITIKEKQACGQRLSTGQQFFDLNQQRTTAFDADYGIGHYS